MDRRFLTVLGVSLVFALVVSSVFYQMTARSSGTSRKPEATDTRDLVVTTRPLNVGGQVKPADVKITKIASSAFPKGAYSKVEEVLDRAVISNILMEEPIVEGRLAPKGSGLGLAPTIPPGMRAVTVRVNDVAVSGRRRLRDGDLIQIGPATLRLSDPADRYLRDFEARAPQPQEREGTIEAPAPAAATAPLDAAADAAPPQAALAAAPAEDRPGRRPGGTRVAILVAAIVLIAIGVVIVTLALGG